MVFDYENAIPRILPNLVKSVENIKGDGSKPGNIQKLIFLKEDRPDNVKLIEVVDQTNLTYAYTLLQGDFKLTLSEKIETASYEYKLEASPDGGSVIKSTVKYHTGGDDHCEIETEKLDAVKQKTLALFSMIDSFLKQEAD